MTRPQHSIDGFIPRRPNSNLGERHVGGRFAATSQQQGALRRRTPPKSAAESVGLTRSSLGLSRTDIDESLRGIDTAPDTRASKRRRGKGLPKTKAQRLVKWVIIAFILAFLSVVGWIAYRTLHAGGSIFKGNLFGLVESQPLKEDASGRSNILVLGTSEDDPGHSGANLTDSMMVISVDQKNKTVDMFSIPRDLYVKFGMGCDSGYEGKINEYFSCVNSDWSTPSAEEERLTKTRAFVGHIFGMDIQYAVHVNYTVLREAVNTVGGVDVNIQGDGDVPYGVPAGSVLDRNFDWRCHYKCYLVKYSPGVHHLDGDQALYLAMARGDAAPTYGFAKSNFDRERDQQKIIVGLKQKAASTGTLTNVAKVTQLIDTLGKNLRTNFDTTEIRTLMQLGTDIKPENIKTINLDDANNAVVQGGNYAGMSVVMPVAGMFDYSGIQTFLKQKLSTNPVTRENAQVDVYNGTQTAGAAQAEADKLTSDGFIVGTIATAPGGANNPTEVYQVGDGNSATKAKLESLYGVKVKTSAPPVTVTGDTKFVVILGQASSSN